MTHLRAIVRIWLLFVTCIGVGDSAEPATQAGERVAYLDAAPPADYPPFDASVWSAAVRNRLADAATRSLRDAPDDLTTFGLLLEAQRPDDALQVLAAIAERYPDRTAAAFMRASEAVYVFRTDPEGRHTQRLGELATSARKRLSTQSRESAAHIERALLQVEAALVPTSGEAWLDRLRQFVRDYRGTDAATLTEVEVLAYGRASPEQSDALDAFAKAHAGSDAGAKALYLNGFQLAHNAREPIGSDPTDRLLRLLDVVRTLESGRYPDSEWTRKALSLVTGARPMGARYSAANVDRLLDAYRAFVASHLSLIDTAPPDEGVGRIVTTVMAELYEARGDGILAVERVLSELEPNAPDPSAVRYLGAWLFVKWLDPERFLIRAEGAPRKPVERGLLLQKARDALRALHEQGSDAYRRKALATLASLEFHERNYVDARTTYRKYIELYPHSAWTWVASLRVGQCDEALGDSDAAAVSYRAAATVHASEPLGRLLGHAYAARANEARGRFDDALDDLRLTLSAWKADAEPMLSLPTPVRSEPGTTMAIEFNPNLLNRALLAARVDTLTRSLALPGGPALERGRWLLAQKRPQDARVALERAAIAFPASPTAAEARALARRARLDSALAWANVEGAEADETKAIDELDDLAREQHDFTVCAAKIAKASILWKRGAADEAKALMGAALAEWRTQAPTDPEPEPGSLARDVLDIRDVVFRPLADGIYGRTRWNAFTPPASLAPFVIVNSDLEVTAADGATRVISARRAVPGVPQVVFVNDEQLAAFDAMIAALGGTKRQEPRAIMETPHQPVGPSLEVLALWNVFFAARPGHWGGWIFETFPIIDRITFLNAERTKATSAVTIGYSGATVVLEKVNGTWTATGLVNQWIM